MSHFYTLVLVDPDTVIGKSRDAIQHRVAEMIAPYNEAIEVPQYDEKCGCVGGEARDAAWAAAEKKCGSLDAFRTSYHNMEESKRPEWKDYIAPFSAAEKAVFDGHPMRFKPKPDCEDCHGGGLVKSTYNPRSKWDWWKLGGRWTGALDGYEPWKDPLNLERCDLCGGTGVRRDEIARSHGQIVGVIGVDYCVGEEDHPRKGQRGWCNGCDGRGMRVKFSYEEHDGDIQLASDITNEALEKRMPYAVVTPDGEWWNQGKMGWWGISRDDMKDEDWGAAARDMVKVHARCLAVVVDCHI